VTTFESLLDLLAGVSDPRRGQGQKYKLPYVLLFSILAIVTGCNSYRGIVTFIDVHRRRLNATFGLTWRRAPAHTAVRYILKGLDPADVEVVFRQHAAQVLSAFATDTSLVLAHVDIAEKSNEIPAAQALLAELGVPDGAIVTLDAIHCQKTFDAAQQSGIGLIVQVKSNQPTLQQNIAELSTAATPLSSHHSHDKGRNRDETRTVCVFDPAGKLDDSDWQGHAKAVIRVQRVVYTRNTRNGLLSRASETAFYISNKPVDASQAAQAIRAHWAIETTSHYSRDVTFSEDRSRIRSNPGVFARLRSFGFNILKANRVGALSQDRYRAALGGFDCLSQLVSI
jgi:predicted transposase YbfD/YdcC